MQSVKSQIQIIFFIAVTFMFSYKNAYARLTDGQVQIKVDKKAIQIFPKKNFHLNAEAPAFVVFDALEAQHKPAVKTEKQISFNILAKTKVARLSYYVCDDKKTVCEQHQEKLNLDGTNESVVRQQNQTNRLSDTTVTDSKLTSRVTSEASENKSSLMSLKSQDGRPTLLVFSAPWCPACVRMQTETYHQPQVDRIIKKINFKKLNSDLTENYQLSEQFHVKAIPTLILLNAQGQEVYRWLDFQQANTFAQSLSAQLKKVNEDQNYLVGKASLGDEAAISKLGLLNYNALNFVEAIKWFSLSKKEDDLKFKLAAEVSLAQDSADENEVKKKEYYEALDKAMFLTTSTLDRWRWFVDWIEKKKEEAPLSKAVESKAEGVLQSVEIVIQQKNKQAKLFTESTYGDTQSFELAELYLLQSRIYKSLGRQPEALDRDKKIIDVISAKKLSVDKPGEMLIAIAYLREAQEKTLVEKFYNQLITKYPNTYVYYEKMARFVLKDKKADKALALVEKALQYPEGNEPQLYLLKARILKDLDQKEKLSEVLNQALAYKEINHERFKKTLAQLNKIKDEIK